MKVTDLRIGNTVFMESNGSLKKVKVDIYHLSCMLNGSRKYHPVPITVEELFIMRNNLGSWGDTTKNTPLVRVDCLTEKDYEFYGEKNWLFATKTYYAFCLKKYSPGPDAKHKLLNRRWHVQSAQKDQNYLYANVHHMHELENIFHSLTNGENICSIKIEPMFVTVQE